MNPDVTKDLLEALQVAMTLLRSVPDKYAMPDHPVWGKARSAIARAEAALSPQPDADGWIAWNGGACPLESRVRHQVKLRSGAVFSGEAPRAPARDWNITGSPWDIVAYRVVTPK